MQNMPNNALGNGTGGYLLAKTQSVHRPQPHIHQQIHGTHSMSRTAKSTNGSVSR